MSALDDLLAEVEDVIGGGGGSGGKDKRKDAVATGMEGDWPYTSSSRESGYRGSSYQTNSSARVEHFAGSRSSTDHGSEASFTSSFAASKYDGGQHKEDHSFDSLLFISKHLFLPFLQCARTTNTTSHKILKMHAIQRRGGGASNLDDLLSLTESLGDDHSDGVTSTSHSGARHTSHSGARSRLPVNSMREASSSSTRDSGNVSKEVLLGGSECSLGSNPSKFRKVVNDELLCLKCMCEVVRFADYKWDDSVDYMFFRNFWPEPERLVEKMQMRRGYAAYCCQCSWHSSQGIEHIQPHLRWAAQ